MRKIALVGGFISILCLVTTLYLGFRLHGGDPSVKAIHLVFAIGGASLSILSHLAAILVLLWTAPKTS
jgi:hypothetical protein